MSEKGVGFIISTFKLIYINLQA